MIENEVLQQLQARKSVRVFTDQPVTAEEEQALYQAAFQAPTAGRQQLYTIIKVADRGLKEELAELCDHQPFIATAPLVLVFLADCRRWLDTYRAAGVAPRPAGPGDALLATADAVIAAQNMVVAAHSMGLGSCYIGDILERCERLRELLDLPREVLPAAMLVIGRPTRQQMDRPKPKRYDPKYLVFEDRYRTLTAEEHRDLYALGRDLTEEQFVQEVTAFHDRKYGSDFSREMSRSAAEYLKPFMGWQA